MTKRWTYFLINALAASSSLLADGSLADDPPPMTLASDSFHDGQRVPAANTCDGADRSPALHWQAAPAGTRVFALIVDDPDAPSGNWNHWVLYNVPAATRALGAAVPADPALGDGSRQGTNDFGKIGYGGPCPPPGETHRYEFTLYALSAALDLKPGAKRSAVLEALNGVMLAKVTLTGHYSRAPNS